MFQTPQMKLLNFEQFQNMLHQIQISQHSIPSISPKNISKQLTPYQILNQIGNGKQTNRQSSNTEGCNSINANKKLAQDSKTPPSDRDLSPLNYQAALSNNQTIHSSNDTKILRPSNSNKSIGAYSSRSSQINNQNQMIQQKISSQKNISKKNTTKNSDPLSTVVNTAPCFNTVEEACEELKVLGGSYQGEDESLQMKELSCSIEEDQEADKNENYQQDRNESQQTFGGYCDTEHSYTQNQRDYELNPNYIENNKITIPTVKSRSNSQSMLDPLLQNPNVKKMCEVQKHFCKKRIREFRQPCEDIVQYQEFIKMVNERSSKDSAIPQPSNRRIKTDHSANNLKQKPPTYQNFNPSNNTFNSINQQPNISTNNTQPLQPLCFNSQVIQNRGKPQLLQAQPIIQGQPIPQNILKQQQNNQSQIISQNHLTDNSYCEIPSKIFKVKKKVQPTLQENILAHQQIQQQQYNQFNSNKENDALNYICNKNQIKNTNNGYNININSNLNNQSSFISGSRETSISNYESKNNRNSIPSSKNQQKILPSAVLNCLNITQQQPQQTYNQRQKTLSPFYKKNQIQQERELKNLISRDLKNNSNNSYSNRNSSSFNGCQTNKVINNNNNNNIINNNKNSSIQSSLQNTQYPPISSRSRVSTVEGYDKNLIDIIPQIMQNQHHSKNNSLSIGRQNISKSSDTAATYSHQNNLNLNLNGNYCMNNNPKNTVTFGQSYFKRQQQQQQQTIKNTKNLKHLNFNCLGYIRKFKEILEGQILPNIATIPKDDIIEYQNAYKQSLMIMSDYAEISNNEDLSNFQDFLSMRSKNIYNQFLQKCGVPFQI